MKIVPTILLFLLAASLMAQPKPILAFSDGTYTPKDQDVILLKQAFAVKPRVPLTQQFSLSQDNSNELQAVFSGLFLFYKSCLSSQDNQRCSFYPTCSEYGLEAVKKMGIVRGIISTCDRLSRCNGFSPGQYEIDQAHGRLKDPVKW